MLLVLAAALTGCRKPPPTPAALKAAPPSEFVAEDAREKDKWDDFDISRDSADDAHPTGGFRVTGLNEAQAKAVAEYQPDDERWGELFVVYVRGEEQDGVALFGEHRVEGNDLVFEPRFPLQPGLSYVVEFYPQRLPGAPLLESPELDPGPLSIVIGTLKPPPSPPAFVERVYPSGDVLPENLLKFYLHFSAPMSRGEAYDRVHLLRDDGTEVELPFLRLQEELWDDTGTRFTLLFDPGRIKRGLKPREEVGPALVEGQRYTLLIDRAWRDAEGQPLEAPFRKSFRVAAPDDRQPDPQAWQLQPPAAASREPLTVTFAEPLDHAMQHGVLVVVEADGEALAGEIAVDREETRWRFTPETPWQAGDYELLADATLEDRAGNSIGRPFEVDLFEKVQRTTEPQVVRLPFTIAPPG